MNDELTEIQKIIISNEEKLSKILIYLTDNAIKFTSQGRVEISCKINPEQNFEFCVKDTGIGISPDMHQLIFEPFRQVETGTARKYGGNGVGLSIAKAYVELLQGKIWLESDPGKGTKVYFTTAFKPVEVRKSLKVIDFSHINWSDKTFLIVEDEQSSFLIIREFLIGTHARMRWVETGMDAVEYCRKNLNTDLILMDIKMEGMDGIEAAKLIRKLTPEIPILAQTAYAQEIEMGQNKSLFNGYIVKPINQNSLLSKISEIINK